MTSEKPSQHIPRILYKYLPAERVDILENQKIRFTQPADLNDPFEMYPQIPEFNPIALPNGTPTKTSTGFYVTNSTIKFGSAAVAGMLKTFDDIKFLKSIKEFTNNVGVLSLTEACNNLLMWSHYSGNHTGFVIGFRSGSDFISGALPNSKILNNQVKVEYKQDRPYIHRGMDVNIDNVLPYFSIKSSDWNYEKEWRSIKLFTDKGYSECIDRENKIYLYDCPHESIGEIIIGANAKADTIQKIALSIRSNSSLHHVKVFRAVCKFDMYDVELIGKENSGTPEDFAVFIELDGRKNFGLYFGL